MMHDAGEDHYFIASDGTVYPLRELGVTVLGESDVPVNYQTDKGYRQHGRTVRDWTLDTREIAFQFTRFAANRRDYWQQRETLINVLNPARDEGVVRYRRILPDGRRREIAGRLQAGTSLTVGDDRLNMAASFALLCPDPSFYDPAEQVLTLEASAVSALVVPFSVPDDVWVGGSTQVSGTVDYEGSWRCWPVISIRGPYQRMRVDNLTTGISFTLGVEVSAGQSVVIDLTPGAQSITVGGQAAWDHIAEGNIVDWYLQPGENAINASGSGLSTSTQVELVYHTRYIAL